MNDQQFIERAHANPHDDSPEFLQAVADNPQRQQLLDELKKFDARLKAGLETATPPAFLRQALLEIPQGTQGTQGAQGESLSGSLHPDTAVAAANDSFWRRNAKVATSVAAGLVIAIGIFAVTLQEPPDQANPMEAMVFSHIYSELPFLDEDTPISLDEINSLMIAWVGSDFDSSATMENIDFNFSKDCWVDFPNDLHGFHMVIQGNVGPVTVMVIPNDPLAADTLISDDRFEGKISPTSGGNLVVVGEKDESIEQFSNLLAANINW